jgi:ATP-dependent DNA ligase
VIDLIPAKSAIIDCELVACDDAGLPCFRTLMDHSKNNAPLCLWAFDLLELNGVRITPLAVTDRKEALAELIMAADSEHLQFSGTFADPIKLLETCAKMGLEGIVSECQDSDYRSGPKRFAEDQDGRLARRERRLLRFFSQSSNNPIPRTASSHTETEP